MRSALWVAAALVVSCLNVYGQEAERGHSLLRPMLRRATLIAACGASFWDYHTTAVAARYGGREANGWMADGNGRPRLGLMLGVKTGMCGLSVLLQETRLFGRRNESIQDSIWTTINAGMAARYTAAALHNRSAIERLKQQSPSPAPVYLAPAPAP